MAIGIGWKHGVWQRDEWITQHIEVPLVRMAGLAYVYVHLVGGNCTRRAFRVRTRRW